MGFVVSDIHGVKEAIDWYAQRGYPQIKFYNSFHPEWVAEAAAYAHRRGLRVSGHIPAFMCAEEVVRQGFDEIQHINQVLLNFFVKPTDDTRTLARFSIVADSAHALDLDATKVRDFVSLLRRGPTVIDPTLTAFEGQFVQRQGEMDPSYAAIAPHLPAVVQRGLRTNSMDVNESNVDRYRKSYAKMVDIRRDDASGRHPAGGRHRRHGGLRAAPGAGTLRQGRHPPGEVLRIATWNGAQYTRTLDRLGSIAPANWPT